MGFVIHWGSKCLLKPLPAPGNEWGVTMSGGLGGPHRAQHHQGGEFRVVTRTNRKLSMKILS